MFASFEEVKRFVHGTDRMCKAIEVNQSSERGHVSVVAKKVIIGPMEEEAEKTGWFPPSTPCTTQP